MKTLIFMKESDLRPAGGPAGFCYNVMQEIHRQKIEDIEFLPGDSEKHTKQIGLYHKITNLLPNWLNAAQIAFRRKKDYRKMVEAPALHHMNLNGYDVIHFHSTISLYKYRRDLETYQGKVILTTHSPIPQYQEIYAELPTQWEKKVYKQFYATLDQIDEYAFNRADYVIFPCEEAEGSYLKNWKKYKEIHDKLKNQGKLVYIPTGIEPKKVIRDRKTICNDYAISQNKFIVSYAGRHNQVKGYDLLQQIAQKSWDKGECFQFLICGKESPIHGLNNANWKEIGWTTDSQSVIAASDVFVLPNRETYFDIIMLEVLSCGKIVVASRTGGNKYFERIDAKGIFLYDTVDEAVELLKKISEMSIEERNVLEAGNKELFNDIFTTDKYVDQYRSFLRNIS